MKQKIALLAIGLTLTILYTNMASIQLPSARGPKGIIPLPTPGGPRSPAFVDGSFELIVGTDDDGNVANTPVPWPQAAGTWNGKAAKFNPATNKLVFETYRADKIGFNYPSPTPTAGGGVRSEATFFKNSYYKAGPAQAGPNPVNSEGTTVLYVADADGKNPICIGCDDVQDGVDGVFIYKIKPSTTTSSSPIIRQNGSRIYANQHKDLAAWSPNGLWIFIGIEMPIHAGAHATGTSELGMFVDLWAVSASGQYAGKYWVNLTDYTSTWTVTDTLPTTMPLQCSDPECPSSPQVCPGTNPNCRICQYQSASRPIPFSDYSCSLSGEPPPANGHMRATVGNKVNPSTGRIPLFLSERVGLNLAYTTGGIMQLAKAEITFTNGLPSLVNYQRNLTPTPTNPTGVGGWSNPGGNTTIGTLYEGWSFNNDDTKLGFSSDAFYSTKPPATSPPPNLGQSFWDIISWAYQDGSVLTDESRYDSTIYNYENNAGPYPVSNYGHWEEGLTFSLGSGVPFFAFTSSANMDPPWDPYHHHPTMGLDVWAMRTDRLAPAVRLTFTNNESTRKLTYPTSTNPADNTFYIGSVPAGDEDVNPPGAIYRVRIVVPPSDGLEWHSNPKRAR